MPVAGLIHADGKPARSVELDVVGRLPVSTCWLPPIGVAANTQPIAGTERPLAVVTAAPLGLIATSTGTGAGRVVLDCASSRPLPMFFTVPLLLPPPLPWAYVVAVVPM